MGLFSKLAGSFVKERVSYTKTAFQLIIEDFKRYILILKYAFIIFSASTLIYGIVIKSGNYVINCALLGLLILYSILDAIFKRRENPNPSKKLRLIYAWMKIGLNALALLSSLYSIYSAASSDSIKPISIVLITLSIIMFILKVLIEICLDVFSSKWALIKNAMIMDAKEHPSTSAKIFSPFIGDFEEAEVKEAIAKRIIDRQSRD